MPIFKFGIFFQRKKIFQMISEADLESKVGCLPSLRANSWFPQNELQDAEVKPQSFLNAFLL
jgi:hypothetical protein